MNTGRLAGVFYLGTFVTGMVALAAGANMTVANAIATICYVGVTVLFYVLFRPVNSTASAVAAVFSAIGCTLSALAVFHLRPVPISELAFFGCYCIMIGWLIVLSPAMPSAIGILLAIGGVSWLTFAVPALARALSPYNYGPGILAEGALTIWLLVKGVTTAQP
jgi:hypothetical protein